MKSLKNKLTRMKSHMSIDEKPSKPIDLEENKMKNQVWSEFSAKECYLDEQYTVYREVTYPLDHKIGHYSLSLLKEVVKRWNEENISHPLSVHGLKAEELLFFDIETTGLGSGTGNTIFLIGYCHLEADCIKVKQYFLPGPAHEAALYYHFLNNVDHLTNLVTYNGKAFDWPQIKTRHTFVRDQVPILPQFGHFDLLHAARRLWKEQLPSCRLSIVENEILGMERKGDTPGSLAPLLYFDFLRENDPTIIEGVLKHNEQDVLSLIALYISLSLKVLGIDNETSTEESYQIARWYESLKQIDIAIDKYKNIARQHSSYEPKVMLSLGLLLKKQRKYEEAVLYLTKAANSNSTPAIEAYIELAKIYEHQQKDLINALRYTEAAYHLQKKNGRIFGSKNDQILEKVNVRLVRLKKKLNG